MMKGFGISSISAVLIWVGAAALAGAQSSVPRGPSTTNTTERARIDFLSLEVCRAEFRWLDAHWRKLDLSAPPVHTDGWTTNIAQAEWPVLGLSYHAYSAVNLAKADPTFRDEGLAAMRMVLSALQSPRIAGFMKPHFGDAFGPDDPEPAVFLHGHYLNVALQYRLSSGDAQFDEQIHRVARLLARGYTQNDQAILPSYPDMWWLTDNFPALSALMAYDRAFHSHLAQPLAERHVASIKRHYLDTTTGMFCTYALPRERRSMQGPRGISQMYGLHFLRDFAPEFAVEQYALARRHLFSRTLGIPGVREFPKGMPATPDVDSGPLILGIGPSASGFAVAAAAMMGDRELAAEFARAAGAVGLPIFTEDKMTYALMPAVGQGVILYGKSLLLLKPR
jgi:hypothetical protein